MSDEQASEVKSPRSLKSPTGRSGSHLSDNERSAAKFVASGPYNGSLMMTGMSTMQNTEMMQARNELKR